MANAFEGIGLVGILLLIRHFGALANQLLFEYFQTASYFVLSNRLTIG